MVQASQTAVRMLGAALILVAGSSRSAVPPTPASVPAWRLAAQPSVNIGVVEGDPHYELASAISAVRLSDGRIAVANAGSDQIYLYDAKGTFLRAVGHRGGGPGEFKGLGPIFRLAGDSLAGFDGGADRLNVYTPRGEFARVASLVSVSGDSIFPLDVWLHGRFWIHGALRPAERAATKTALDRLPVPTGAPTYRYVRTADDGTLWIREPLAGRRSYTWTLVSVSGQTVGTMRTPVDFDVYEILPGSRMVLGRWRDTDDVNFIRLYAIERTGSIGTVPAWLAAGRRSERPGTLSQADQAPNTYGRSRARCDIS